MLSDILQLNILVLDQRVTRELFAITSFIVYVTRDDYSPVFQNARNVIPLDRDEAIGPVLTVSAVDRDLQVSPFFQT